MAILPPSLGGSPGSGLSTGIWLGANILCQRYAVGCASVRDRSDEVCARSEQG
jgi:hypothetical protein